MSIYVSYVVAYWEVELGTYYSTPAAVGSSSLCATKNYACASLFCETCIVFIIIMYFNMHFFVVLYPMALFCCFHTQASEHCVARLA